MLSVTFDEVLRDPSKYLRQVESGETFVILQAEKAIADDIQKARYSSAQLGDRTKLIKVF